MRNINIKDYKQLLDEAFVISGIIKVEALAEAIIIQDITKTVFNY